MTRFLSEALEAKEPYFRRGLMNLERSSKNSSTDIRLTNELIMQAKAKMPELGLDSNDTHPHELYEALKQKLKADDKLLTRKLRTVSALKVSAEAEVVSGMTVALNELIHPKNCFALKTSKLKTILKSSPPKKAMKALGYRSMDSMLKLEPANLILAAAWLSESNTWHKHLIDQYKKLNSSDFEDKSISILSPRSKKWQTLASKVVDSNKHNLIAFKELGSLVLLPLPEKVPDGVVTASICLALHELNEIRACSSYLKLNQVKPKFGELVAGVVASEPVIDSTMLNEQLPWNLLQNYYTRLTHEFNKDVFEPYVSLEDMLISPIEKTLSQIEPLLSFWVNSAHLGVLHDKKAVSFNVLDNALNLCNNRSFDNRFNHNFKKSLKEELMIRYLHVSTLRDSVMLSLQPDFAFAEASS